MELFLTISIIAIIIGGVISAFSARVPSRFIMWFSAYLVLIVGLVQLGFAFLWQQLNLPTDTLTVWMFTIFNLGSIAVIAGRANKPIRKNAKYLVAFGSVLILSAVIVFANQALANIHEFSWLLVWMLTLCAVIIISAPIGLVLAARRHKS